MTEPIESRPRPQRRSLPPGVYARRNTRWLRAFLGKRYLGNFLTAEEAAAAVEAAKREARR
jgi:hypothetical protein